MSCSGSDVRGVRRLVAALGLSLFAGCAGTIDDPARFEGQIVCEVGCVDGDGESPAAGAAPGATTGGPSTTRVGDGTTGLPAGDSVRGASVLDDQGCRSCHGADLTGAAAPSAWTPNLTSDKESGLGSWTDAELATALRKGQGREGQDLCGSMPTFSKTRLADPALADLIAYLRALPALPAQRKGSCP